LHRFPGKKRQHGIANEEAMQGFFAVLQRRHGDDAYDADEHTRFERLAEVFSVNADEDSPS